MRRIRLHSNLLILGGFEGFPVSELERGERLQIMLSAEEFSALENWRFEKRMPSRAAAVRELLRRGLAADGFMTAQAGIKSQDFGVIANIPDPDGD
jgi:hypothetical protein